MARSARSSAFKKNNQKLAKTVFGPAEHARAERLNAKLQELVQAAKPSDALKMDVESTTPGAEEVEVAADSQVRLLSNTAVKKAKEAKKNRIEKKKVRKERNKIAFKSHRMKGKTGKK
ncbi:hypothetical protein AMS68_003947 [Peltaster fructicola]|uniref:DUF2423 domain-containing protein n=1 Tax=Peltaster fructicola TaxID=286661 RepID=A0A6H0XVF6_9PEZI|nr:hypothetical protein AMS68_003947 [Peltaster fructicola]